MLKNVKVNNYLSSLKDVLSYIDYVFPMYARNLRLIREEPFIYFLLRNGTPYLRVHDIFLEDLEDGRKLFDMSVKKESVELSKLLFENASLIRSRKNFLEFKINYENGNVIKIEKDKRRLEMIDSLFYWIDFQNRAKTSG